MIAWSLGAFGGIYVWAALPAIAGCALLALIARPRIGVSPETRTLDWTLLAFLACAALQLVPLPGAVVSAVAPQAPALLATVYLDHAGATGDNRSLQPLSIDPRMTAYTLSLLAAVFLFFWSCRRVFEEGATRRVVRGVAWLGLAVSLVAIVQRAMSPLLIYGHWAPLDRGAISPFGPFVNRNHFATWVLMGFPVTASYLIARRRRPQAPPWADRLAKLVHLVDTRTVWLTVAGCVMLLALVASLSRSGLLGLAAAVAVGGWLARRRLDRRARIGFALYTLVLIGVVANWGRVDAAILRFAHAATGPAEGRLVIWRDTGSLVADFWLTGTGLGTYQTAMLVYQRTARSTYYNHAHNLYLQLMAEGGLLLVLPAAMALVAFARLMRHRLKSDSSYLYWFRAGAATGLVAVALQSLLEGGLRMPANALLGALLAALAVHEAPPWTVSQETGQPRGTE